MDSLHIVMICLGMFNIFASGLTFGESKYCSIFNLIIGVIIIGTQLGGK
jgi:hypothetical protein